MLLDQALYRRTAHMERYENRKRMQADLPQSAESAEFEERVLRQRMGLPIYPYQEEWDEEDDFSISTISDSTVDDIPEPPVVEEQEKPAKKGAKKAAKKEVEEKKGKKGKAKKK